MRFYQKYSYNESDYGEQTVLFVVSDVYSELIAELNENDLEVNTILLDVTREDLNGSNGSFAIDELSFSINELACETANDAECLQFILKASNVNVNRYCSVFFDTDTVIENRLFHGKISDKISADDKLWYGAEYEIDVLPKREWKFSAKSFDISMLENAKMNEQMEDAEGNTVTSAYDKLTAQANTLLTPYIFPAPSYSTETQTFSFGTVHNKLLYLHKLVDLKSVLTAFMTVAKQIFLEKDNTDITFVINENTIGIVADPTAVEISQIYSEFNQQNKTQTIANYGDVTQISNTTDIEYSRTLIIDTVHTPVANETTSPILISRKMIIPEIGSDGTPTEWEKNQWSSEKPFTFKQFGTIADMLFSIAKSLGCYILVTPNNNGTEYNVEFKSVKDIKETDITYIKGVTSANIDLSSNVNDKIIEYYSHCNNLATDGIDNIDEKSGDEVETENHKKKELELKNKKENDKVEPTQLLFSTSSTTQTWINTDKEKNKDLAKYPPYNTDRKFSQLINISDSDHDGHTFLRHIDTVHVPDIVERFTSALYMRTVAPEARQRELLPTAHKFDGTHYGTDIVYRPISQIHYKNNGIDKTGTLTDYINDINNTARHYYKAEYTLKVPFWNGFSKYINGQGSSWKNIKLGSVVIITDKIKDYQNNTWSDVEVEREYMVTSIERNLQTPETTLKLVSTSAYSYGDYTATDVVEQQTKILTDNAKCIAEQVAYYEIGDPPYAVTAVVCNYGDFVQLNTDGTITKAISKSAYYNKAIGVLMQSGIKGDVVAVQKSGEVYCENFNFTNIGGKVYARTNFEGFNIYESFPNDLPTADEDMIIEIGTVTSVESFLLNIRSLIVE